MTYVVADEKTDAKCRVRVNGKHSPRDTMITMPSYMEQYKKTTLVTYKGKGGTWHVYEDRVDAKSCKETR